MASPKAIFESMNQDERDVLRDDSVHVIGPRGKLEGVEARNHMDVAICDGLVDKGVLENKRTKKFFEKENEDGTGSGESFDGAVYSVTVAGSRVHRLVVATPETDVIEGEGDDEGEGEGEGEEAEEVEEAEGATDTLEPEQEPEPVAQTDPVADDAQETAEVAPDEIETNEPDEDAPGDIVEAQEPSEATDEDTGEVAGESPAMHASGEYVAAPIAEAATEAVDASNEPETETEPTANVQIDHPDEPNRHRYTTRLLSVRLTDAEMACHAHAIAEAVLECARLESRKTDTAKEFKVQIDKQLAIISDKSATVRAGEEYRDVPVVETRDWSTGQVWVFRSDTLATIECRDMTAEERQMEL